jgi:hypothetical protein
VSPHIAIHPDQMQEQERKKNRNTDKYRLADMWRSEGIAHKRDKRYSRFPREHWDDI